MSTSQTTLRRSAGSRSRAASRSVAPRREASGREEATDSVEARTSLHFWIFGLAMALVLFGLVMVLSASSHEALDAYRSPWAIVRRQATWAVLGLAAMVFMARSDYRTWRRFAGPALIATFVMLVLVIVPGNPLAISANGSSRWLGVGLLRVQPSELAKIVLVVFAADLLARREDQIDNPYLTLRPIILVTAALSALVMLQPDLGTTIVVCALAFVLAYVAGSPLPNLGRVAAAAAALAVLAAILEPYRRERILSFLNPAADVMGDGYQGFQSRVGLANGGLLGTGLGNSRSKWGFLPESHTDFIFAIVGEELGFVGATILLLGFTALVVCGVITGMRAPDRFGHLLAVGISTWFAVQGLVNIGAVAGVMPITGIPLPFVSYGGSSLVPSLAAAGLLVSIARAGRTPARR